MVKSSVVLIQGLSKACVPEITASTLLTLTENTHQYLKLGNSFNIALQPDHSVSTLKFHSSILKMNQI